MGCEPGPELTAVDARERWLTACVERRDRLQPRATEEVGEVIPAIAREQLRGGRVAKDARLGLLEDPVAGQRAQHAVERVGVDAILPRERFAASGPGRKCLRYAQVGGESERTRHQRAPQRVPDHRLGVHGLPAPNTRMAIPGYSSTNPASSNRISAVSPDPRRST